ncbi:hypothetical protein E5676_scaffold606G00920 [Cucumis melo var. makuwa]|uniref:Uncharacterized protein n=1 Tax=Cucumis melo var. makuwa TaxID=1194695 RepID=A0A5D3CA55_CUCMM|nr:hypothetical protein E6C27_scaffold90G00880 [Cucumis melo var. makuwa]TYK07206.1 hypothetical protein E5676_scaffold606G00920 [Cucumis melo var. makuwa]
MLPPNKNVANLTLISSGQPITPKHFSTKPNYFFASAGSVVPSKVVHPNAFNLLILNCLSKSTQTNSCSSLSLLALALTDCATSEACLPFPSLACLQLPIRVAQDVGPTFHNNSHFSQTSA